MISRILEPEVMDDPAEVIAYDAMDFSDVNQDFANLVVATHLQSEAMVLDLGTGTARIPIFVAQQRSQWQIIATDLAPSMLEVGQKNVDAADCTSQIQLQLADSKNLSFGDRHFDLIVGHRRDVSRFRTIRRDHAAAVIGNQQPPESAIGVA